MANQRQKRLMQEALDADLSEEARTELYAHLQAEAGDADLFERLRRIDRMLRLAPHERAPQQLALRIMARLAEELQSREIPRISGLALALALALLTGVVMPLLLAASWLLLSTLGNSALLASAIEQVVRLLALVMVVLEVAVRQLQTWLQSYPEVPALMIAVAASALLGMFIFARQGRTVSSA